MTNRKRFRNELGDEVMDSSQENKENLVIRHEANHFSRAN